MFKNSMDIIFSNIYRLMSFGEEIINCDLYHELIRNNNIKKITDNYNYYTKLINDINLYNLSKTHCINVLFNKIF